MSLTADIISEDGLSYFVKTHIFLQADDVFSFSIVLAWVLKTREGR